MTSQHYISPESDRLLLPMSASVIATLLLTTLSALSVYISTVFQVDLHAAARVLSTLTATSLLIIAMRFCRLNILAVRKMGGCRDVKSVWLCVAVAAACVASASVISFATSSMHAEQEEHSRWTAMSMLLISSLPTAYLAAKSTLSVAALFDALRATEKARRT